REPDGRWKMKLKRPSAQPEARDRDDQQVSWNHASHPLGVVVMVAVLDERRPVLGGSTIAAAAGIVPYCSPIGLWLELTGKLQREESEPMRIGKVLEPAIFTLFRQDGYDVTRTPDAELRDPALPWLVGHPDGFGA